MRIHKCTAQEVLAEQGPVLVRLLDGATTERSDIDYACAQLERMLQRYPAVATVAIVEHGTPIPSADVGRYTTEHFGRFGHKLVYGAVLLGLGFWAKAATGITVALMRKVNDFTVVYDTTLPSVADQVARELVGLDPQELLGLCERVRAREFG